MSSTIKYELREPILEVKGLSVARGGVSILKNLDLEIRDLYLPGQTMGQVVGLLGPSGVGKTTLFRTLAGLDEPDTGTIHVMKKPLRRGSVGVVAQHYPLFRHRTVWGNLMVVGGKPQAQLEKEARDILERFGVSEHANKYPSQLSGGQRQRVAIAQQFLCSDNLLLMDEPFSGLDPLAIDRVVNFISEIIHHDELKTFILVTHDIAAALRICDTVWLLGRDHDSAGKPIPGARVICNINLIDRGIAWREDTINSPEFFKVVEEIRELFSETIATMSDSDGKKKKSTPTQLNPLMEAVKETPNVLGLSTCAAMSMATLNPVPLLVGMVAEAAYLLAVPDSSWYGQLLARRRKVLDAKAAMDYRDSLKEDILPSLPENLADRYRNLERQKKQLEKDLPGDDMFYGDILSRLDHLLESFLSFAQKDCQFRSYLLNLGTQSPRGPEPGGKKRRRRLKTRQVLKPGQEAGVRHRRQLSRRAKSRSRSKSTPRTKPRPCCASAWRC